MAVQRRPSSDQNLRGVLRALAEPRRVEILKLVHKVELPAGEIAEKFQTSRQAISQHLRMLTELGLLDERRDGTKRLYTVRKEAFADLREFVDMFWGESLSPTHQSGDRRAG